jgi:toluene monooxygenase system protein A
MLNRSDWYDIARDTNWTPRYVAEEELFPPAMSDPYGISWEEWETFDEPYKVSYREYVRVQREKDADVYSVKAALSRSKFYENADPSWIGILKLHYGVIPLTEYAACQLQAMSIRFGKAPGWRNTATFGLLDELRHTQLQLYFPHELVSKDRQFDWAHQAHHTKNWLIMGGRHCFDDVMMTRDAVANAVLTAFSFETAFTNLQMIGLASDAAKVGDWTFTNLITSIQSDEARHAQIGMPLIEILLRNRPKAEIQQLIDIGFWRLWRIFAVLTGVSVDYYIPVEKREGSFKEFMHEWVINQYDRQLKDLGLDRPWYWDIFLKDIETHHHIQHGGIWSYRETMWWDPVAGVGPEEREWLEEKYPGWKASYGYYWDTITQALLDGREDLTRQAVFPPICNMCQIPIANRPGPPWQARVYPLEHEGRRYHFCTEPCRWIFTTDPDRYKDHESLVDMLVYDRFDPATPDNILKHMGINVVSRGGRDAHNYAWIEAFRESASAAE